MAQFWRTPATIRFWAKVTKTDSCWIWTGAKGDIGHGLFRIKRPDGVFGMIGAHRFAYIEIRGEIPEGMVLDHVVCSNPSCVNPAHLDVVTNAENTRRRHAKTTHCKNGHEFTPENTGYRMMDGHRGRVCRQCGRDRAKVYNRKVSGR
jgi:hypothetical protein